jgi:hypothetical protein
VDDGARFGSEFIAAHRARYGGRSPERRQLTYDIAVEATYEPWRRWYDKQLALLPTAQANALAGRLWLDEHFWPVTFELAAGAAIRAAGYSAVYEQDHGGLTPDWAALTPQGELAFIIEVHTEQRLHNQPPFGSTARRNVQGRRPMPIGLGQMEATS